MIVDTKGMASVIGKVIVVEDDDLMQAVVVEILSDLGGSCHAFVTADDALMSLLQSVEPPVLIVTDYTLPGQLDGREFALMVNKRWPAVPIVLTSGYGSEVVGELPGRMVFLQKPWSVDQMANAVTNLIAAESIPAS